MPLFAKIGTVEFAPPEQYTEDGGGANLPF